MTAARSQLLDVFLANELSRQLACGMMITSDRRVPMSTRTTVCCMGQGQGAGTAAALCAAHNCGSRDLFCGTLRDVLNHAGVLRQP